MSAALPFLGVGVPFQLCIIFFLFAFQFFFSFFPGGLPSLASGGPVVQENGGGEPASRFPLFPSLHGSRFAVAYRPSPAETARIARLGMLLLFFSLIIV